MLRLGADARSHWTEAGELRGDLRARGGRGAEGKGLTAKRPVGLRGAASRAPSPRRGIRGCAGPQPGCRAGARHATGAEGRVALTWPAATPGLEPGARASLAGSGRWGGTGGGA